MKDDKTEKNTVMDLIGHDYIGRVKEIRKLLAIGLQTEALIAIAQLENDMNVVLDIGDIDELDELEERVLN